MQNLRSSRVSFSRLAPSCLSFLLAGTLLAVAPGCGGGGAPTALPGGGISAPAAGRGQVRFTIKWPENSPTRLIPQAAQSIKFRCLDADDEDEVISEVVVRRDQTVATLDLPSVWVKIIAEAHAGDDGTGQVLAKGNITVQVKEAQVSSEKLTLDSVISEVKVDTAEIDLPANTNAEVNAYAVDATGAVVLTAPGNWEWTPENALASDTVDFIPAGDRLILQAKKDGTVVFTVKETETGKTARVTVISHAPTTTPTPTPTPTTTPTPDNRPRVTVRVSPGPNGEYRAVEIYVADTQLVAFCDSTRGSVDVPFNLTLAPGKYYIWAKDVSNDPSPWYYVDFDVTISGITSLGGACYKNDYRADIFYVK